MIIILLYKFKIEATEVIIYDKLIILSDKWIIICTITAITYMYIVDIYTYTHIIQVQDKI